MTKEKNIFVFNLRDTMDTSAIEEDLSNCEHGRREIFKRSRVHAPPPPLGALVTNLF